MLSFINKEIHVRVFVTHVLSFFERLLQAFIPKQPSHLHGLHTVTSNTSEAFATSKDEFIYWQQVENVIVQADIEIYIHVLEICNGS